MRVELPGNNWAEFRDITDLKAGDAKAIRRATRFKVSEGTLTEISMGLADDQMDALLARIITSWSLIDYGHPMADPNSLDNIPLDVYDALVTAAQPYKEAVEKAGKLTMGSGTGSAPTSQPGTPSISGEPQDVPTSHSST